MLYDKEAKDGQLRDENYAQPLSPEGVEAEREILGDGPVKPL
jgi:hypothetical protein